MTSNLLPKSDRAWLFYSLIGLGIFYLNLIWKTTGDVDRLAEDCLFLLAIFRLLWQKRNRFNYDSNIWSSFWGVTAIALVLGKTISLFWFESNLLALVPFFTAISLALIASGFQGLWQYKTEFFLILFLFFPEGIIGHFIDNLIHITVLTASVSTYFLYYFGFNVVSRGNEIILSLPNLGDFKAIVDYPCAGIPMMLLMLKLALLLVNLFPVKKTKRIIIPLVSVGIGFILGAIRVCILTLLIPDRVKFDYWHGSDGSQIFSTLGIVIFSGYCYWLLEQQQSSKLQQENSLYFAEAMTYPSTAAGEYSPDTNVDDVEKSAGKY